MAIHGEKKECIATSSFSERCCRWVRAATLRSHECPAWLDGRHGVQARCHGSCFPLVHHRRLRLCEEDEPLENKPWHIVLQLKAQQTEGQRLDEAISKSLEGLEYEA